MRLDRRLAAAAVAGVVVVTALAGAAILLQDVPEVRLSEAPSDADHVTLYQNGLAFVELHRTFDATPGEVALVFSVPLTAIFDSLVVEGDGIAVKELRSSLAASPFLEAGDRVVVHVETRAYEGTILSAEGGQLLLDTGNGTTLVDRSKVEAIEIVGRAVRDSGPGSAEVVALVEAAAGPHEVRLSYLATGPGWTPSYRMELPSGAFAFEATLTGLADWRNVTLDLVAGAPNVVASFPRGAPPGAPPLFDVAERGMAAGGTAADDGFAPSQPLGESLHRYRLERNISMQRGETLRLPVLEGEVAVLRQFFEAQAGTGFGGFRGASSEVGVRERAEFRNTLPEPLPPGVVRFYRDQAWIGEDMLQAVPRNDTANVTLAKAEEVKARVVLESMEARSDRDVFTYALTVENLRAAPGPIDLRATLTLPTYRTNVLSVEPEPTLREGGRITWDADVARGEAEVFRVTYEQLRER